LKYKIVIPARKNSKRFPSKNTINFIDKPLINHTIEFALKSFEKEDIWVNTDDEKIYKIANDYNVKLSKRPIQLGTDYTSTSEVLIYQSNFFSKMKIECDAIILLQATNPLRPKNMLMEAVNLFEANNRGSLATFSNMTNKIGEIRNDKFIPLNYLPGQRSQDLLPQFYENGLLYITKLKYINEKKIITDDVLPYIYNGPESTVDIDEPFDLEYAEFIYKHINKQ
jgi:CMP-N-acetylneuraminic acid synthetase